MGVPMPFTLSQTILLNSESFKSTGCDISIFPDLSELASFTLGSSKPMLFSFAINRLLLATLLKHHHMGVAAALY